MSMPSPRPADPPDQADRALPESPISASSPPPRRPLVAVVATAVCIGLVGPAAITGGLFVARQASDLERRHAEETEARVQVLAQALPALVWRLDREAARPLVDDVLASGDIVHVQVIDDASGTAFLDRWRPGPRPAHTTALRRDLVRDGVSIGHVEAEVDPSRALAAIQAQRRVLALAVAAQLLVSLGLIVLLLTGLVVRPLRRLSRFADELAAGGFDAQLPPPGADEIGHLGMRLEATRDALNELFQRRQQALQAAEGQRTTFMRLFQSTPVSTSIYAVRDWRIRDVNSAFCARYGLPREACLGQLPEALGIGLVDPQRTAFRERLARESRVSGFTASVRLHDGGLRDALLNAETVDFQGEPCYLVISLDITELREAERARQARDVAEAANRAKTAFLSHLSHELRTPLNAVLGFSQLLASNAAGRLSPEDLAQVRHIHEAGWHLLGLVNDVLDITLIEDGRIEVSLQPVPPGPIVDEVVSMLAPTAHAHGVEVDVAPADPGRAVHADDRRLRQVLVNLLSNAIKYNRPGGRVRIGVALEGERVAVRIADTGLGMTREQLDHLFEPFNRLGRESSGIQGTGIGLALSNQMVRLMRGDLRIESRIGEGTTATVLLDAADATTGASIRPAPAQARHEPRGTVLYVEDNPVNALLVGQMLSRWSGVDFLHAEDAAAGLALARERRPAVVLLDRHLPDMDGFEVLGLLRADPALRETAVVMLSASAMPEDLDTAKSLGATQYWTKPLHLAQFLADIDALLARSEAPA